MVTLYEVTVVFNVLYKVFIILCISFLIVYALHSRGGHNNDVD